MLLLCLFSVYTDGDFVNIEITKGSITVQYNKNSLNVFFCKFIDLIIIINHTHTASYSSLLTENVAELLPSTIKSSSYSSPPRQKTQATDHNPTNLQTIEFCCTNTTETN